MDEREYQRQLGARNRASEHMRESAMQRPGGPSRRPSAAPSAPAASAPAEAPRREGLVGKGFTAAEIRALHEAAGPPRTEKREFGPGDY